MTAQALAFSIVIIHWWFLIFFGYNVASARFRMKPRPAYWWLDDNIVGSLTLSIFSGVAAAFVLYRIATWLP